MRVLVRTSRVFARNPIDKRRQHAYFRDEETLVRGRKEEKKRKKVASTENGHTGEENTIHGETWCAKHALLWSEAFKSPRDK